MAEEGLLLCQTEPRLLLMLGPLLRYHCTSPSVSSFTDSKHGHGCKCGGRTGMEILFLRKIEWTELKVRVEKISEGKAVHRPPCQS